MKEPVHMMLCLSQGPAAVLSQFGFKQSGLIFRRTLGDVENVVECHLTDVGTEGDGWFVFELGANHRCVDKVLGNRRNKDPRPGSCTINGRLNRNDDDNDTWWALTPGRELWTARHAAHRLRKTIENWFTVANDLTALNEIFKGRQDDFWDSDLLAPAAIAMVLGQVELGRERLDAVVRFIHATREGRPNSRSGSAVLKMARHMTTGK